MKTDGLIVAGLVCATMSLGRADSSTGLPGPGFSGDRYETLWTKSPFAIATPDAGAASVDYALVGVAQFGDVTYVSLVDKQTQEHFVLTTGKSMRNLSLVSIARGSDGASATIRRDGETLVLRQEQAPAVAAPPVTEAAEARPVVGGPPSNVGGVIPPAYNAPPRAHVHRLPIAVPARPGTPAAQRLLLQQQLQERRAELQQQAQAVPPPDDQPAQQPPPAQPAH